jgi:hypothetical protein
MKKMYYCQFCDQVIPSDSLCRQCGEYTECIDNDLPIALLNTSIVTSDGQYSAMTVGPDYVACVIRNNKQEILSAIGHNSTAQILTELLGIDVSVNRIQFEQQPGQIALVFKLNGRPPEGKILSQEEIEAIGYKFQILRRIK